MARHTRLPECPALIKVLHFIHSEHARILQCQACELGNDMPRSIHHPRSILNNILLMTSMLGLGGVGTPVGLAQRAAIHSPAIGHINPPISRPPISRPPALAAPPLRASTTYTFHSRPHFVRPRPPVFPGLAFPFFPGVAWWGLGSAWGFNSNWWTTCHEYLWPFGYNVLSFYQFVPRTAYVVPPYEYPVFPVYLYGEERRELPQLFLKDGSVYDVTDYWVANGQLHFTTPEEGSKKPIEHRIGFDELDLQRTIDMNAVRGFRFVLRNRAAVREWITVATQSFKPANCPVRCEL
jgi:hypothetical protein